jgi:hypothetical protein
MSVSADVCMYVCIYGCGFCSNPCVCTAFYFACRYTCTYVCVRVYACVPQTYACVCNFRKSHTHTCTQHVCDINTVLRPCRMHVRYVAQILVRARTHTYIDSITASSSWLWNTYAHMYAHTQAKTQNSEYVPNVYGMWVAVIYKTISMQRAIHTYIGL